MKTVVAKLKDIYFHELGFQCIAVRSSCDKVFE